MKTKLFSYIFGFILLFVYVNDVYGQSRKTTSTGKSTTVATVKYWRGDEGGLSFSIKDAAGKTIQGNIDGQMRDYVNGLAAVNIADYIDQGEPKGGLWGFVDKNRKIVIPIKYTSVSDFHEGLCKVELDGKFGYVNTAGKVVVPLIYDDAQDFSEGFAGVNIGAEMDVEYHFLSGGKWGFIDKTGKVICEPQYLYVHQFKNGYAGVENDDLNFGFIDASGTLKIPLEYEYIKSYSEEIAPVEKKLTWGYINKKNETVIPFKFSGADPFVDSIAVVNIGGKSDTYTTSGGKFAIINHKGELLTPAKYYSIEETKNGLMKVQVGTGYDDALSGYINHKGKEVIPPIYKNVCSISNSHYLVGLNNKWGIIDSLGNTIIPVECDFIASSSYGYIEKFQSEYDVKRNNKYGYIDGKGKFIIPAEYDSIGYLLPNSKMIFAKKDGKFGFIDRNNKTILPFQYEGAGDPSEGMINVKQNGKWGYIDLTGKALLPFIYTDASPFYGETAYVELNGKSVEINKKGIVQK